MNARAAWRLDASRAARLRAVLLGTAAGLAIGIAGSPTELCAVAFAGPALLLLALEGERGEATTPGLALLAGLSCGVAANALTMIWIVELLEVFGSFPAIAAWPVGALLWIAQALPFAIAAWMSSAWMTRGMPGWLALPACLTVASSIAPMLFPWRLGVSQMPDVVFVQLAEIGGPPLLDLLLALGSCAALEALRRRRMIAAVVALFALGLPYVYGAWRMPEVRAMRERAPLLRVGVVQPNLGILEKHDPSLRETHMRLHRALTRELEAQGAELVIWPESSFPFWLDRRDREDGIGEHRRVRADGVRGPVIFGALSFEGERRYNSVVAIARDGAITGVYDKIHLLAFGEYIPLWDFLPPIHSIVRRGFSAGISERAIPIAGTTIGPLNCYEDLLVEHARLTAGLDPGFLANFTNDAWFGDTGAPHLHHMLARLRAVETRRDMVRAVNTGISALVTATGEDEHRTRPYERTTFLAPVRLLEGVITPWVRYGDLITPALLGALLGIALALRRSGGLSRPSRPAR